MKASDVESHTEPGIQARRRAPPTADTTAADPSVSGKQQFDAIRALFVDAIASEQLVLDQQTAAASQSRQELRIVLAISAVLALLLATGATMLLTRDLAQAVRRLAGAAQAIAGGDLSKRIGLTRGDELGLAATAFDCMADRLQASIQQMESILANVGDGIIGTDAHDIVTFANPTAGRLLGYATREMIGQSFHALVGQRRTTVPIEYNGAPMGESGSVIAFRDVSDRRRVEFERAQRLAETRARQALEALDRDKDEFLAQVSHDLRNPLSAIKAAAQILQRQVTRTGTLEPASLFERISAIELGANTMSAQIDELLDLANLTMARSLGLDYAVVDLVRLVRLVALTHQQATEQHTLVVDADTPEFIIRADRTRLERVVANLVTNALKYSPMGGTIVLSVRREDRSDGAWAICEVRDAGIGIPADDMPRLFERFHRGANVNGTPGIGLGLAAVQQLVQAHRGHIEVVSHEGQGSTFTVSLPIEAGQHLLGEVG